MKDKRYRGAIGIATLLYLLFTQVTYGQDTEDFIVSGGTTSFANGVLTVSGGEVTVSTKRETSQTIKLTGGKLTLDGVQITVNSGDISPIEVEGEAEINLANNSENTLTSKTEGAPGIHVPPGSQVTFTGDGILTAENAVQADGSSSCGIGGKRHIYSCGTIIFDLDGTITAQGGSRGAGIGTCMWQSQSFAPSGTILIKKGTINAAGGEFAIGIGTGPDGGTGGKVTVTIMGGHVTASKIGNGSPTCLVDIFILGGYVDADIIISKKPSSLPNNFIIGPDATIGPGKTYSENHTNGFIFTGSPKTAIVRGDPEILADMEMTIDEGETLTIPDGATIINRGKIINNGKIEGDGTISGNQPQDKDGNELYKVSFNLNGGNGIRPASQYIKAGPLAFPSCSGLIKEGYTCLGWNTTNDATEALTEYAVKAGANTLYAVWKFVELELPNDVLFINGVVGTVFTEVDLSRIVSNKEAVLGVTFALKQGNSLPTGFSLSADGKLTGPNPVTTVVSETATIVVTPNNGAPAKEFAVYLFIMEGALVVTPAPDQTIYAGEYPAYTLPEYITEEALLTGNLAVGNGVITQGNLALTDKGRENYYTVKLSAENIPITQKTTNAADAVAEIVPSGSGINQAGWYRNPVSLKAPGGFNIWVESAQALRNICLLTEDGIYTSYRLVQKFFNAEYTHDIDIKLDQTAPKLKDAPTVSFQKAVFTLADTLSGIASYSYQLDDAAPSEIKTVEGAPNEYEVEVMGAVGAHTITFTIWDVAGNMTISELVDFTLPLPTVTLPEVEGVTFNPLAGSHEVKLQDNFYFSLTLNEGYREKSKPIVTTHLGETIEPRQADGSYLIKNVNQDIVISISGIVPDISTGITDIDNETHIRVVDGTLQITVPQTADAWITDMSGRILHSLKLTPGTTSVEGLHSGIYIVKISGQKGRKVIIHNE